jgi:hypothetical protein
MRDADFGFRRRGRVVHAVACHGDSFPVSTQLLDDAVFVIWSHTRFDIVDTELLAYGLRRGFGFRNSKWGSSNLTAHTRS